MNVTSLYEIAITDLIHKALILENSSFRHHNTRALWNFTFTDAS